MKRSVTILSPYSMASSTAPGVLASLGEVRDEHQVALAKVSLAHLSGLAGYGLNDVNAAGAA